MDPLDGRYSRMSGQGTPFGGVPRSRSDRNEEGIVDGRRVLLTSLPVHTSSPRRVVVAGWVD